MQVDSFIVGENYSRSFHCLRSDIMDLEKVKQLVLPYLEAHNLILYDVKMVKEYGFNVLQVSVDKEGGIDSDSLALVNEYLSEKLDAIDSDMPEYMLEVCSPGAEKPLRNMEEVKQSIGQYVNIKTKEDGVFEGYLEDLSDDVLVVKINVKGRIKNINIKYEDIKKIRLAVKF